jgi:regulator of sigma E protease
MLGSFRGILGIAFCLGFAILVHELGHFVWAKLCGVRVIRFSIGFGKFILKWTYKGTEYGIAWFPFGGYVLMHGATDPGEEPEGDGAAKSVAERETAPREPFGDPVLKDKDVDAPNAGMGQRMMNAATDDVTALASRPYYQKMLIYSGGVAMNWLTAIVTVGIIYWIGFDIPKSPAPVVGFQAFPEALADIDIQAGDRIVAVDGNAVQTWREFEGKLVAAYEDYDEENPVPVSVELERPGTGRRTLEIHGRVLEKDSVLRYLSARHLPFVEEILPNKPADKAGLRRGDLITAINGEEVNDWQAMASRIRAHPGKPVDIEVRRGEEILRLTLTPEEDPKNPGQGQIGILQGSPERELRKEPFATAMLNAPDRTWRTTVLYVSTFAEVIRNAFRRQWRAVGDELGGPIQIAQMAYRSAQRGLIDFLWLFFSINIALAVFNLIPIPLLDGSLLVFATYEAIIGRPFPRKLHIPLLYAGLIFIVLLSIVISVNDVRKIFG